jgi:hypothetical protein
MTNPADNSEQISSHLRKVLNTHGHGFHYAVVRRGEDLSRKKRSAWLLDGTEIPVVVGDSSTHVDFVLSTSSRRTYLVGECKRADPAKARWCFARAPYTWRDDTESELIFDQIVMRPDRSHSAVHRSGYMQQGSYRLGFELRTGQAGDGAGVRGSAIEAAVAQVLRSASGLINQITEHTEYPDEGHKHIKFIPAIFTTAELWTTDVDLGAADLATGNLSAEQVNAQKTDWLWFTYNRSPALSHFLPYEDVKNNFSKYVRREFARSIAIVSVGGIDEFLGWNLEEWLE